jgi:hypothetical protein
MFVRNVEIQLHIQAGSYSGRQEFSATPLGEKKLHSVRFYMSVYELKNRNPVFMLMRLITLVSNLQDRGVLGVNRKHDASCSVL